MIEISIPEFGDLKLEHLVCDFTGTLSVDGALCPGAAERLNRLAEKVTIHILTADTFGTAKEALEDVSCRVHVFKKPGLDRQKEAYISQLGREVVAAVGNGRNDRAMLASARLGITVCLKEGCSVEALTAGEVLVFSIEDALDLLLHPKRLIATLRN